MRKVISLLFLFLNFTLLQAQRGKNGSLTISVSQVAVNEYTTLTANAASGATSIQVSNSSLNSNNRFTEILSGGDLLLIIQMQGAQIVGGNVPEFGTITNYNGAGNFEWAEVKAVPSSNQIELMCGLQNSYLASGKTQVIRVPRYKQLTVSGSGGIIAPQWDGITGGIVGIEIDSAATLNSANSIDVSGKGFRGGTDPTLTDAWWGVWDYSTTSNANYGAQKGESIAGWLAEYDAFGGRLCRGAAANGGGGGNAHNAGGGGGANASNIALYTGLGNPDISTNNYITAWNLESPQFANSTSSGGGKGGYSHTSGSINALTTPPGTSPGSDDDRRNVGGLGGRPLDYSGNRIFMGGGGGGGEAGSNAGGNGGNGGGIILIRSFGAITGNGALKANGSNGSVSGNDGAGGGGGGGAILIQSTSSIGNINLQANGGNGGNQDLSFLSQETQGPGGGGGGGYIAVPYLPASSSVNGGNNGTTDSINMNEFQPNGATKGGSGIVISNSPVIETLSATTDTVCNAGFVILSALNSSNYSYAWGTSSDNFDLGSEISIQPFVSQITTFYLNSCSLNQTIEVVAIVSNAPLVDAGENATICQGQAFILNASAEGTYFWDASPSLSSINLLNQSVSPENSGYFYLNASFNQTCSSRDSILITVLPTAPLELFTNTPEICAGEFLELEATATSQVAWISAIPFIETNFNTIELSPLSSGTIYASVSATGFCETTDSLSFTVNELPTVDAGTGTTVCAGTSAQLQGTSNADFTWFSNATLSNTAVLNPIANPSENSWYYLESTTPAGCTAIDSVFIQVGGAAPISAGSDTSICAGTEVLLLATGGNSYTWNNGQMLSDSTAANPLATLTETTSFIVTGSIDGSCIARDTVTVNVFQPATPNLTGGGISCNSQPVTVSISGVQSVTWVPSEGLTNSNALSTQANPSSNTNYIANYIDLNGCAGSSEALTVGAGISPVTGFAWDQISNFEVVFEANTSANQTSTWLINDTILVGDSVVYNFPYEYLWNVVQIVDNECGSDTFSLAIEVIKQVGIEDLTQLDFYIYPNPSSNQIAIRQVNGFLKSFTLQVFNSAGQRIESINHLGGDALVIDVRNWSSGVYDFVFNDLKQIKHLRFIR
jgi:hypothetical protein